MRVDVLGIDPGKSGGLALIKIRDRVRTVQTFKMPESYAHLTSLIVEHGQRAQIFIEQIPKWCGTAQYAARTIPGSAMAVLYGNYSLCLGICHGAGFARALHLIAPLKWQNLVQCRNFERLARGPWKRKLKARAQELFPELTPRDYDADAILIAHAGWLSMFKRA